LSFKKGGNMRKYIVPFLLCISFIYIVLLQLNCSKEQPQNKEMSPADLVAKGKYLVNFGGCNDCHSPKVFTQMGPVPDTTKLLSGHPAGSPMGPVDTAITNSKWVYSSMDLTTWVGPWGVSYPANLTPDGPTGTGNWTEDVFMKAMRTGKHLGVGRHILPPMPWFDLAGLTDNDLKAIFAYLKSLPPIKNQVPDPIPPNMITQTSMKSK
jgi:mono/diheme cytochrome c family protein